MRTLILAWSVHDFHWAICSDPGVMSLQMTAFPPGTSLTPSRKRLA